MKVQILNETGTEEALLGLSLSFYDHNEPLDYWWTSEKQIKAAKRAVALAHKGGGHNKFLASINIYLYIQAPRCWWSEWDTYKVGVTANSSSTMHTLDKRFTGPNDYEEGTSISSINSFNECLKEYRDPLSIYYKDVTRLKLNLPEGWLQERQICMNYMSLQNVIRQRTGHRLKFWKVFIDSVLEQVEHPEFLINANKI